MLEKTKVKTQVQTKGKTMVKMQVIVGNEMKHVEDMIGKQSQGISCQGVSWLKLLPLQETFEL